MTKRRSKHAYRRLLTIAIRKEKRSRRAIVRVRRRGR
jgi:hypothetical protein